MILLYAILFLITFVLALLLFALPASLSLKRGRRQSSKPLTSNMAADQLKDTVFEGIQPAEAARFLVAKRMIYWRRNSFDNYTRAFKRGYGACRQHAYALADLLNKLGFEGKVVHAIRSRFADGQTPGTAEELSCHKTRKSALHWRMGTGKNWTNSIVAVIVWPRD